MKIGFENKKNINQTKVSSDLNDNLNLKSNEPIKYDYFSKSLNKKFYVDYQNKKVLFEDGVAYTFNEISEMKKNIKSYDVPIGHLLKEIFGVTYVGNVIEV